MSNQLITTQEEEQLALISRSKGITGSGKITAHANVMNLEFKAQNQYKVGKTTIKAADVSISEVHFIGDKTEYELIKNEIENDDNSSQLLLENKDNSSQLALDNSAQLVLVDENSLVQLNNENPVDILEEIFNGSAKLENMKNSYKKALETSEYSITHSTGDRKINIQDGVIKIDYLTCKNFAGDKQFRSLDQVQQQIELDNSLSIEDAEAINNELYQKFPILNSSTPVVINLNNKVVNQLDLLLSRTYSADHDAAIKVAKEVISSYGKHYPVFNDIFAVINLGIAKGANYPVAPYMVHITRDKNLKEVFLSVIFDGMAGSTIAIERNEPLRIIHSIDRVDLDNLGKTEAAGIYKAEYNVALFLETGERAVHEFTHAVMNIVFNNKVNPYSLETENSYHAAVKNFLLNLNIKLEQSNDYILEFGFNSIRDTLDSLGIIELLGMAKDSSLDIKKFFTSKSLFSDEMIIKTWRLEEWKDKYFKDSAIEEITKEQVIAKLTEKLEKLDLTPMEIEFISRVSNFFYRDGQDSFNPKLAALMIDSYSEHEDKYAVEEILSLDFIHNLNVKLGKDHKDLLESEISEIYNYLKDHSILDLLAMSITPSLDIKKFFKSKNPFSDELQFDTWALEKWKDKYFKDSVIEEITNEQIITRITEETNRLDLTHIETVIISRVSVLFFHYDRDQLDGELPAQMLDLYHKYGEEAFVKEIYSPIHQYWLDYIHPVIEQDLIIPHQLECNGTTDTNIFTHCVQEFMA